MGKEPPSNKDKNTKKAGMEEIQRRRRGRGGKIERKKVYKGRVRNRKRRRKSNVKTSPNQQIDASCKGSVHDQNVCVASESESEI